MENTKKEQTVIKLVRKANELVEARYKLDIWETRVFTKMLTMVRRHDDDFQTYRIYLKDVIEYFEIENNKDAYDRLRVGGMKLMSKMVKVVRNTNEGLMELNTPIVVGVDTPLELLDKTADGKFIDVSFHPGMKPFLLSLQSHFTTYDARNILKLPSAYSIRIYELLKQYQKIGKRKFDLTELKEIIGVIEEYEVGGKKKFKDNYPLYGNFNQRVLKKAKEDLKKHTDISFTYETIKKGRAVVGLVFFIKSNTPTKVTETVEILPIAVQVQEPVEENPQILELYELIKEWVSLTIIQGWFQAYSHTHIQKAIQYTLKKMATGHEISNVGGYLNTILKEENLVDVSEIKKEKAAQALVEKRQEEEEKTRQIELEQQIRKEQYQREKEIVDRLIEEEPLLKGQIAQEALISLVSGYNPELPWEQNLESQLFQAFILNTTKRLYPEFFK